ncbi:hypothetical protein J6590_006269 [Homalodisca vitripennis]|nr:hypothetical protein J6590_006269 [Homalodisca vitripennis]
MDVESFTAMTDQSIPYGIGIPESITSRRPGVPYLASSQFLVDPEVSLPRDYNVVELAAFFRYGSS